MRLLSGPWGIDTEVFWSETVHVFCKHQPVAIWLCLGRVELSCAVSCLSAVIPEDPVNSFDQSIRSLDLEEWLV